MSDETGTCGDVTYHHAECGTRLRVKNAVLENGETWCPECSCWFIASSETLEKRSVDTDTQHGGSDE